MTSTPYSVLNKLLTQEKALGVVAGSSVKPLLHAQLQKSKLNVRLRKEWDGE